MAHDPITTPEDYPEELKKVLDPLEALYASYLQNKLNWINNLVTQYILTEFNWVIKAKQEGFQNRFKSEFTLSTAGLIDVYNTGVQYQLGQIEIQLSPSQMGNVSSAFGVDFKAAPTLFTNLIHERDAYLNKVLEDTTFDQVTRIIEVGTQEGWSYKQIAKRISEDKVIGINSKRAELIARTEVNHALNEGQRQYAKSLGVQEYQVVLAQNACEICRAAYEGKTFQINNFDDVPPKHPNCRCVLISVVPEQWLEINYNNYDFLTEHDRNLIHRLDVTLLQKPSQGMELLNVQGGYDYSTNSLYINPNLANRRSVFYHELGHVLDKRIDVSMLLASRYADIFTTPTGLTPDARYIYEQRVKREVVNDQPQLERLISYQPNENELPYVQYLQDPHELLAEAYKIYRLNPTKLRANAPNVYNIFRSLNL